MTHYIWKIPETSYNESDGFIFKCTYYVEAWEKSDRSGASSTYFGDISFTKPSSGYIDYSSVTEANVIQWVKDALGSTKINEIETQLTNEINQFIYTTTNISTTKTGVPWGT